MKKIIPLILLCIAALPANASTAYGTLNNFDAVNDTGVITHGFEIEIDDVKSTSITYTYDWNHYGHPTITGDNSDPLHPKTFTRYASKKDASGAYLAFTNVPVGAFPVTNGHQCTNPAVNTGCEHFGVGYYAGASLIKYNWLIDDSAHPGNLIHGPAVQVGTPTWTYVPPAPAQLAQVIAVIPAPVPPAPLPAKKFAKASWVKVIKTKLHNNKDIPLDDLIGDDKDHDGKADWANGEDAEVESEWHLLQANAKGVAKKQELEGKADELQNGDENVTRRYEFYKYAGSAKSIDGENGEAMCDEVDADNIHGVGVVEVTDAFGVSYSWDCSSETIIGDYTGAQMAGFAAEAPLGLIEHIEDGKINKAYTDRTVVVGGNTPYVTQVTGSFPAGLTINSATGVLSGMPSVSGVFTFTVNSTDADNANVSKTYTITIEGVPPTISTAALTDGTELTPYSFTLSAAGGTVPYSWTVNALPAGLSLSVAGVISGTPAKGSAGVSSATYTVTDKALKTATKLLTLKINAAPAKADLDADGDVDLNDLKLMKGQFGQVVPANSPFDLNGDLKVNIIDFRRAVRLCTKAKCAA